MMAATDRCTGLLAEHAVELLFVQGINYPYGSSGCGHAQGLVQCLTASKPTGAATRPDLDGRLGRHADRPAGEPDRASIR